MYPFPVFSGLFGGSYAESILDFQNSFNHRALLLNNGKLYTQGYQPQGVLGNGINSTAILHSWFNALSNIKMVRVGYLSTVAITNDNKVYSTGSAQWTGIDTGNTTFVEKTTSVVPTSGALFAISDIVDFSVGRESMLILTSAGNLYGVGINTNITLGTGGAKTSPILIHAGVKKIKAGIYRNSFLTLDGKVFVSGLHGNQFGNSATDTNYTTFTEVTNIDQDGILTFVQDYGLEEDEVTSTKVYYAMGTSSISSTTVYTTSPAYADDTRPSRPNYAPRSISTLTGVISFYHGVGSPATAIPSAMAVVNDGVIKFIPGVSTANIPSPISLPSRVNLNDVIVIISNTQGIGSGAPTKFLCAKGALFVLGYAGDIISGAGTVTAWTKVTIPTLDA